jgi:serine/threonine-protein kinase
MLGTELGACETFVWEVRRSNLVDRDWLDRVVAEFLSGHPGAEPPHLAEHLVQRRILTQFQADRLQQGEGASLVLGPFTLFDALGTGSMGTVYKARSEADGKWYAVKVLPRRSMWSVRLARRKVRAFEQCRHPALVPFVDVSTSGAAHYLAWPLVEGEPLDRLVQRQGRIDPGLAARYALQTAEGLDACHRQGLFHGLLKPSNLMIGTDGKVRVVDLGIGSLLAETEGESLVDTMSTANAVSNVMDCVSPESILDPANLTPAADQYSLGCVLYFCLTGQYPFPDGTAVEKVVAHQTRQPRPVRELSADVPDGLAAVIDRLMQKTPAARYPSTAEVVEVLRPMASPTRPLARPDRAIPGKPDAPGRVVAEVLRPSRPNPPSPPPAARSVTAAAGPAPAPGAARSRGLWAVSIALAAALAGGLAFILARSQHWF